jgi:hypothetical protein
VLLLAYFLGVIHHHFLVVVIQLPHLEASNCLFLHRDIVIRCFVVFFKKPIKHLWRLLLELLNLCCSCQHVILTVLLFQHFQ